MKRSSATPPPLDQSLLAALFASLPLGVVVHGLDGRIVSANDAALETLGLSLDQITGKTSMDPDWQAVREDGTPFPGEQHPAMICLATGRAVRDVLVGVSSQATREQRWLRVHGNPLRVEGSLVGAYSCFEDISEHRRTEAQLNDARKQAERALRESEARYRTIVESAPDAIMIYVDQQVVMVNPACVDLFRANSAHDLLGKDIWSLSSPRSHRMLRQRVEHALRGGINSITEVEIMRLDGTSLPAEGVSVAIDYQGRRAIHVMMRDATPRKQAEALLRQHREEMERALAFQVAQQTVAGIAHELNQPLNAITTLAEAAQRQLQGLNPVPARLAETLTDLSRGAQRAGRVVHELMGFLRKPDLACVAVDLTRLLHEAVIQCRAGLSFTGDIEVRLPDDLPPVAGSPLRIEKIVGNLLRNAVEACQSACCSGRICRIVIVGCVDEKFVRLQVEDNGPGVPADVMPRLFHPFVSSKPGGIGMGLPISQVLARSLGGGLEHQAASDGGARFILTLPVFAEAFTETSP